MDIFAELFGDPEASDLYDVEELARVRIAEEEIQLRPVESFAMDDIYSGEGVDMGALQQKLDHLLDVDDEVKESKPTRMVRAYVNGQAVWLTIEQANLYLALQSHKNIEIQALQMAIRRAMKGNVRLLRQEMLVILAIAFSGINKYIKAAHTDPQKARDAEKELRDAWEGVKELIVEITSAEDRLKNRRDNNPQIEAFENLFGEFLNARQKKNLADVERLRRELVELRDSYLVFTEMMKADMLALQQSREQLQRLVQDIFAIQRVLAVEHPDVFQVDVVDVQNQLTKLKSELAPQN